MRVIIILQLLIAVYSYEKHPSSCKYKPPNINETRHGIVIAPLPNLYKMRSSDDLNLRIHFEYTDSFNLYVGSNLLKKQIMEPARLKLQSLLKAKNPTEGILRVDRSCIDGYIQMNRYKEIGCGYGCTTTTCGDFTIPKKFLNRCKVVDSFGRVKYSDTEGVGEPNVDIVILVQYVSCSSPYMIAYALSCFTEKKLDRPILGIINLCPNRVMANLNIVENTKAVEHELIHALGFAVDKYAFYRYSDGSPIVPRDVFGFPNLGTGIGYYKWNNKIAKLTTRRRSSVTKNYSFDTYSLVLPNVVKTAQAHFNCSDIKGVDLEEAGDSASALAHFDELFLNEELMTPMSNGYEETLSKFTLALLKDTGWYNIDCTNMEDLKYGKNAGCDLPLRGCYNYMKSQLAKNKSIAPFCNKVYSYGDVLGCNANNYSYGYCDLVKYQFVDPKYRYFTNITGVVDGDIRNYTGSSMYNEYCPVKRSLENPNFNCRDENNNGRTNKEIYDINAYGNDSKCFHTLPANVNIMRYGASCIKVTCINNENYALNIGGQTYNCKSGADIRILDPNGKNTTISCGDYRSSCAQETILNSTTNCNFESYNHSTNLQMVNWLLAIIISLQFWMGFFGK